MVGEDEERGPVSDLQVRIALIIAHGRYLLKGPETKKVVLPIETIVESDDPSHPIDVKEVVPHVVGHGHAEMHLELLQMHFEDTRRQSRALEPASRPSSNSPIERHMSPPEQLIRFQHQFSRQPTNRASPFRHPSTLAIVKLPLLEWELVDSTDDRQRSTASNHLILRTTKTAEIGCRLSHHERCLPTPSRFMSSMLLGLQNSSAKSSPKWMRLMSEHT